MQTLSINVLSVLANAANNFNGNMLDNKKHAIALLDALQISKLSDKDFALSIAHLDICADDAQYFAQTQYDGHIFTAAYSFIRSLRFLANTILVKHSKTSGGDRTNVQEFLQLAAEKYAAAQVTAQPQPETPKHQILVELDECLNAQIAAAVQTAPSPAQALQNEADEANTDLADYLDLYPEAGFEFADMPFNEVCTTYQRLQDADEKTPNTADSLTDKFIADFAEKLRVDFDKQVQDIVSGFEKLSPNARLFSYQISASNSLLNLHLIVENGNDFRLKYGNFGGDYFEKSEPFSIFDLAHQKAFLNSEVSWFLRHILQQYAADNV